MKILKEIVEEETGGELTTNGKCLSDLSLFMAYCSENSFNYGVPTGREKGGGPHLLNEHIVCEEVFEHSKRLALLLMRM